MLLSHKWLNTSSDDPTIALATRYYTFLVDNVKKKTCPETMYNFFYKLDPDPLNILANVDFVDAGVSFEPPAIESLPSCCPAVSSLSRSRARRSVALLDIVC